MNGLYERFQLFMGGGMAGGIGVTVVYPIDVVKTRMQNQRGSSTIRYKSSFDCARQLYRNEKVLGFYRGLRPQLLGVAPEKAIKLAVNDIMRSLYQDKNFSKTTELMLNISSGSVAGMSQVIVTNPLEICKIRLQVHGELHPNQPLSLYKVVSELGFKGLYRGSSACMMRDIPFSAIYFPVYSILREKLTDEEGKITGTKQMVAGMAAGICSSSATTPADVVKTRLQVKPLSGQMTYDGIIDCYKKIIRYEGARALFKGMVPRISRSAPQFGVTLYFYEMFKSSIYNHQ